jgi:hypothetical protein
MFLCFQFKFERFFVCEIHCYISALHEGMVAVRMDGAVPVLHMYIAGVNRTAKKVNGLTKSLPGLNPRLGQHAFHRLALSISWAACISAVQVPREDNSGQSASHISASAIAAHAAFSS